MSLCAPDVVVDDHGSSETLVGREELRELFGGIFPVIPDVAFERIGPAMYSSDRTTLCARWRISGTGPNGQPFTVESVDLYRFRNGLVSEYTIFIRDVNWLGSQLP